LPGGDDVFTKLGHAPLDCRFPQLTAGSAAYRLATIDLPTFAVVVATADTDVCFEPSARGTTHFETKPGTVLRVLGEREG
jgi:hypothetical protein